MQSKTKPKDLSISEVLSFPNRIQNTLIFYYLFPVLLIFVILSSYFYISTKNALDDELGKQLLTVSWISSSQVKPVQFVSLQTTGKLGNTFKIIQKRFQEIAAKNEIDRIYLLDTKGTILLDSTTDSNTGNLFERYNIHGTEINEVLQGTSKPSTLFKGKDGYFYKTAFSPLIDRSGNVYAIVGVDGNATFFENLRKLERRLIGSGVIFIIIILLISYILSRKIVSPIELLALAAKRIGDGQIEKEINVPAKNEVGFLSYVMDEMRKKILERDQSLQVMLRGIAHEVRNPLGGIELFSGLLKEKVEGKEAHEAIEKIIQETNNLKKLVDEFLHFAKKPAIQTEVCDLHEFLEDIEFHWSSKLKENQVQLHSHVHGPTQISWDVEKMKRVFHNLIENSLHAMSEDKKLIEIEVHPEKNHTIISIQDSGCGISEENQQKLFKPFFTTKTFGNGLGLAMVQKIVQAHGGDVEIHSEALQGTKVVMILPNNKGL